MRKDCVLSCSHLDSAWSHACRVCYDCLQSLQVATLEHAQDKGKKHKPSGDAGEAAAKSKDKGKDKGPAAKGKKAKVRE